MPSGRCSRRIIRRSDLSMSTASSRRYSSWRKANCKQRVSGHSELAGQLPQVLGNRIQLQQVLLNLTVNAIDAMTATTDRERLLCVRSEFREEESVLIT